MAQCAVCVNTLCFCRSFLLRILSCFVLLVVCVSSNARAHFYVERGSRVTESRAVNSFTSSMLLYIIHVVLVYFFIVYYVARCVTEERVLIWGGRKKVIRSSFSGGCRVTRGGQCV